MACKDAKKKPAEAEILVAENTQPETNEVTEEKAVDRLFLESIHKYSLMMFFKTTLPYSSGQ